MEMQTLSDHIQNLEQQLNNSGNEIQMQVSALQDHIQHVDRQQNRTNNVIEFNLLLGTLQEVLNSCKDLNAAHQDTIMLQYHQAM